MRVLAIDDENKALKVLCDSIKGAIPDAELFASDDPNAILDYAKKYVCDIAFCDIQMSKMTGLELAYQLKLISPKINVIFCTGYSNYAVNAVKSHASGYLMKPVTSDDITNELKNLLYPLEMPTKRIYAQTFGNFDVFFDGKPIYFARGKAKELLAYLIDRKGASVTRRDICAVLFEDKCMDDSVQNYFTKIFSELNHSLESLGQKNVLIKNHNQYSIDMTKIDCDAYLFLAGDTKAVNSFRGEYMSQYDWADQSIWQFDK